MKLYAISDLHLDYQINYEALEALPAFSEDRLILAGDIGTTFEQLRYFPSYSTLIQRTYP